jgi:glycerol-3-phosphate O-acyltransferase
MGHEIVNEINKVSVVSPFSLVAAGLLCYYRRGISHDDLMDILNEFYDYLIDRQVKFSSTFVNKEKALSDALGMLESSGFISKTGPEEDDEEDEFEEIIYSVDKGKRLNLEYHKNSILHSFVSFSFVSISILSGDGNRVTLSEITTDYRFFKDLFKYEFIYDNNVDDRDEVHKVISYARDRGIILVHEDGDRISIEVTGKGGARLHWFAGLIQSYLESYWVVARGCVYLKNKARQEKDLVKKIQKLGAKIYKKGEISKTEALSQSNYKNALKFLMDSGAISASGNNKNDKGAKLLSLDNKGSLESLRRRLFKFMM